MIRSFKCQISNRNIQPTENPITDSKSAQNFTQDTNANKQQWFLALRDGRGGFMWVFHLIFKWKKQHATLRSFCSYTREHPSEVFSPRFSHIYIEQLSLIKILPKRYSFFLAKL